VRRISVPVRISSRWLRDRAETRYAPSGEISIAYRVYGGGPIDIILVLG
jgi:hypothetical protein